MQKYIEITGARQHNLANIDSRIPRDKFCVITGLSGSGKSSLAFDTIYAEGQRRYVESLSSYARMFLGQMSKPDVDNIEGLSPAVSIDQKTTSRNPRSTVGTTTEIYDYLRLLFARVGVPHCPECGREISAQTTDAVTDDILKLARDTVTGNLSQQAQSLSEKNNSMTSCDRLPVTVSRAIIMAPVITGRKGEYTKLFADLVKQGFSRVRIDGEIVRLTGEEIRLNKQIKHFIDVVVDRVTLDEKSRSRISAAVELSCKLSDGRVLVQVVDSAKSAEKNSPKNDSIKSGDAKAAAKPGDAKAAAKSDFAKSAAKASKKSSGAKGVSNLPENEHLFSLALSCPEHGYSMDELQPRDFSFNAPYGACSSCAGIGFREEVDITLLVPDKRLSIAEGCIEPFASGNYYPQVIPCVCEHIGIDPYMPWQDIPKKKLDKLINGCGDDEIRVDYHTVDGRNTHWYITWEGIRETVKYRLGKAKSDRQREKFQKYFSTHTCSACKGKRLRPEILAVTVGGKSIYEITCMSAGECYKFFDRIERHQKFTKAEHQIADPIIKEVKARLKFLVDVGLDYLTLERATATLSGGEAQRIRLATQIGAGLVGVLYILDEPSIGLHQRDNARLIAALKGLRDLGNTVCVVEHDEETIRSADYVVDIGPGAGEHGGQVVAAGTPAQISKSKKSITADYLMGRRKIEVPAQRRAAGGELLSKEKRAAGGAKLSSKDSNNPQVLTLTGCKQHNLCNVTLKVPLSCFNVVTGVSGSGKSSLIADTLAPALANTLNHAHRACGEYRKIDGLDNLDKVIIIDQSPIGRTPRSNPATYVGLWDDLRALYASTPDSKARGYSPGRFSFNVPGGRCEACKGDGQIKIEMHFLPDIYVPCEECSGSRYNRETLQVRYRGKTIADLLDMTVEEALHFFEAIPSVRRKLQTLHDVGLGYIHLGQPATTLSGGEAQRVKLSSELQRVQTGRTFYILDEPTTGLHFEDVRQLLGVLNRLVETGNTVLVIEHNLDVIKCADNIIDLGPEGGAGGGKIIATGTPEELASNYKKTGSYTGEFLAKIL